MRHKLSQHQLWLKQHGMGANSQFLLFLRNFQISTPVWRYTTYSATLKDGSVLPSWLAIDTSSGNLTGTTPKLDVRENPKPENWMPI